MLRLGETKLALDEAVAGESEETDQNESVQAKMIKASLMSVLRKQFEEQQEEGIDGDNSRGTSTGNGGTEQNSPEPLSKG
jgi:SWI/SNF-related matrix-associated actin-dependent regulator 1 of chromatin subfamily A